MNKPQMSFQGKYTGHQGVYFCPSGSNGSSNWWVSVVEDETCLILSAHTGYPDHRVYFARSKAEDKVFKPDKLIVPMEYLT